MGGVQIGGGAPVVVQSMTCTDTADAENAWAGSRVSAGGCDIVRGECSTGPRSRAFVPSVLSPRCRCVADIHFNHKLAIGAVEAGAAKLRINPSNIGDWAKG